MVFPTFGDAAERHRAYIVPHPTELLKYAGNPEQVRVGNSGVAIAHNAWISAVWPNVIWVRNVASLRRLEGLTHAI